MRIRLFQPIIFYISSILVKKISCSYKNENREELMKIINNEEIYENLGSLEDMILQTLKQDNLKLPIIRNDVQIYFDSSKFKMIPFKGASNEDLEYVVPTANAEAEDIIKYEHALKIQIAMDYKNEHSDLIKKKILVVRTLKIIKIMQIPMNEYKRTHKLNEALRKLNNIFINKKDPKIQDEIGIRMIKKKILGKAGFSAKNIRKRIALKMPLDFTKDIFNYNDLLFTYQPDIGFMRNLDLMANYFDIGVFNYVGSHFIALGHFLLLKLAHRHYNKYFEIGNLKFHNWHSILQFNHSDRYKVIDIMCDESSMFGGDKKRRELYLKSNISPATEECIILEFLIHHINKYQMELFTNAAKLNLNLQMLLENDHLKERYFNFMCKNNSKGVCSIYDSPKFKEEDQEELSFVDSHNYTFVTTKTIAPTNIDPHDVYLNYINFIKYYNEFNGDQILYIHLLNFIGLLDGQASAHVASLFLPGYYNAIQLAYEDNRPLKELYEHLIKCVEMCYTRTKKNQPLTLKINSLFKRKMFDSSKCKICEGTLFYINNEEQNNMSMLQKYNVYTTKILKVNIVSSLIRCMNIFEEYNNFLMHDLNWFTFLFLFRMTSYKDIPNHSISNAMYLDLKDEDTHTKTIVTYHWYPSYLKKYITNRTRENEAVNLLEELEKLIDKDIIEKMKKCIKFVIHVTAVLQMDFFYYLNETPLRQQHPFGLMMDIEAKFREWFNNYLYDFLLINYENPHERYNMPKRKSKGEFIAPQYSKWTLHLKKIIEQAFINQFNQKHVKTLFKHYDTYNINNKIMLLRDSYELYLKNFENIYFIGDIMLLRKFFGATPKSILRKQQLHYFVHNIFGNPLNFYKFGLIYGYTFNKEYLKQISDALYVIYQMNRSIFTEMSFLQTVRLLFRKIQYGFSSHRRNDDISMNNIFFFNVRPDYSKLKKEMREEEIHLSMASRFYEKTMYTLFQMMFVTRLSKHINKLDRKFGDAKMLGLSVHDEPVLKFYYVYHGSMFDSMLNVFFPMFIKKPVVQLKYGKTFVLANMYKLASELFSLYNLNNLSQLCEYQSLTSANSYVFNKMMKFIDKKFIPIVVAAFFMKINVEISEAAEGKGFWETYYKGRLEGAKISQYFVYLSIYGAGNLYIRNSLFFPNEISKELSKQTEGLLNMPPNEKPSVHYINGLVLMGVVHSLSISFFIFTVMRWYAFYDNVIFMFRSTFRIFDRFYTILETYVNRFIKKMYNKVTTDALLKSLRRAYDRAKFEGYYEEAMKSRISNKEFSKNEENDEFMDPLSLLREIDIEAIQDNSSLFYTDNGSLFDDLDDDEQYLNQRDIIFYEDIVDQATVCNLEPIINP
ncbi:cytoadherence linked asexual protein [Plasmodium gonderi]|uniref:Cytoadherence linked asexual protein n=1 Tax=Plasmodium gonderi TaxID=77519 RepID=A0A1Y1JI05_PLAGO|nr:cytoadherence linked asexual protein [Plasmodium gonderi]GAW80422.1 cytoadherence linked asexual protein [Plasmodium gonderi]